MSSHSPDCVRTFPRVIAHLSLHLCPLVVVVFLRLVVVVGTSGWSGVCVVHVVVWTLEEVTTTFVGHVCRWHLEMVHRNLVWSTVRDNAGTKSTSMSTVEGVGCPTVDNLSGSASLASDHYRKSPGQDWAGQRYSALQHRGVGFPRGSAVSAAFGCSCIVGSLGRLGHLPHCMGR